MTIPTPDSTYDRRQVTFDKLDHWELKREVRDIGTITVPLQDRQAANGETEA